MALFKEKLFCPVCKDWLAERFKDDICSARCEECKVTFIWGYKSKIPKATLDSHKDSGCGCGICGR